MPDELLPRFTPQDAPYTVEGRGTVALNVACKRCGGNAGQIVDGALVYTVKHSGEHHTIRIDLKWLEKLLQSTKVCVLE